MLLQFDPNAQLELEEATSYYDSINRKRRCHVDGFPYGVVYRVCDDRIQVLAVMHLQRKPRYWENRI